MKSVDVQARWRCGFGPIDVPGVFYTVLVASITGLPFYVRDEDGGVTELFGGVEAFDGMDELNM